MVTETERNLIRAIPVWLMATRNRDVPTGLSRYEARRRAREVLTVIADGRITADRIAEDGDLMDVLWAAVEELDERPSCQQTFEECDRFYQLVSMLSVASDPFDELDEILHLTARIGWRSAPEGLERVLRARAAVWEHGDEGRHREVCKTAHEIPQRVASLRGIEVAEIREICSSLIRLCNICPKLVDGCCSTLFTLLEGLRPVASDLLDEREFLKAVAALADGMSARQLGRWDDAQRSYRLATSSFRRTVDRTDLDRVEVERLALSFSRGQLESVQRVAPRLIGRLVLPREEARARLILGWSLLDTRRSAQARAVLEAIEKEDVVERDPALHACVLLNLGNALLELGDESEGLAKLRKAGMILDRFPYPSQLALLTCIMGEYRAMHGDLAGAAGLYSAAREMYRELGQEQFAAYMSVLRAELMMLLGRHEEAQLELRFALPLIEKFELRREAIAVVSLLREAMAKRGMNVKAIQQLRDHLRKGPR